MIRIFVPTGVQELDEKTKWFFHPLCQELTKSKNVEFGFEIKGPVSPFKTKYPFGIHFSEYFATFWREADQSWHSIVQTVASLSPEYAVMHGIRISRDKNGINSEPSPASQQLISEVNSNNYSSAALEFLGLIEFLQEQKIAVAVENTPNIQPFLKNDKFDGGKFLDSDLVTYTPEMQMWKKRTGCQLVLDLGHLSYALGELTIAEYDDSWPKSTKAVFEIFNLLIQKNETPQRSVLPFYETQIALCQPEVIHVNGSYQGRYPLSEGINITSHLPVEVSDDLVKRDLKIVLEQVSDLTIVIEVSRPQDSGFFRHLPPDGQETSLYALCQILLEI